VVIENQYVQTSLMVARNLFKVKEGGACWLIRGQHYAYVCIMCVCVDSCGLFYMSYWLIYASIQSPQLQAKDCRHDEKRKRRGQMKVKFKYDMKRRGSNMIPVGPFSKGPGWCYQSLVIYSSRVLRWLACQGLEWKSDRFRPLFFQTLGRPS